MKKYVVFITLMVTLLSSLSLSALSIRIGPGYRHHQGYYGPYYHHYPYRYYYRPYYSYPTYRYYRYHTYSQPIRYCQGQDCYDYGFLADAFIKEMRVEAESAVLVLDNGMVFRIRRPAIDVTGLKAMIFARQDASGNIISFRVGEQAAEGRPDYRLVIESNEYQAERQN